MQYEFGKILFGEDYHINGCNRHYLFNLSGFERGMTVGARRAGRNTNHPKGAQRMVVRLVEEQNHKNHLLQTRSAGYHPLLKV